MAQIILIGQNNIKLNKERAKEIKEDWDADNYDKNDKIIISENNSIRAKDIRSIRISKRDKEEEESIATLSTEEIKNRLGDFEERYEEHKSGDLETYETLGTIDTGIHDWLKEKGVISNEGIDPELYGRFSDMKTLLEELNYRREYAEQKEEESLNQLIKHEKKGT